MASWIELDGTRHHVEGASLRFDGDDWFLTVMRGGEPALELAGQIEGEQLRIDLRSLDEVLGALQGRGITAYPGGQQVCAAYFDVRGAEGGGLLLLSEFMFDWDRALDPPGAQYSEPRTVRMRLVADR